MRTALFFLFAFFIFCQTSFIQAEELVELRPYSRQLDLTGFSRPAKEIILSSEVSGKCTEIQLDVGDSVNSKDVARIDDTFIRLDIRQNEIAQKKTLRQLELVEKTLARFTNLIQKNSTAQADFDQAAFNADNLRLNLQNLQAEETRLKEMQKRHTLPAPFGWRVIRRYIEPGEYIRQGEPVLKLGNFDRLIVPFLLTYEEIALLSNMDEIHLYFPDINASVTAEIHQIAPDFDEQKKKISVELITVATDDSRKAQWRGGLRAELTLYGKTEENTFLVPFSALISRYEANWVITENGTKKRVILLGKETDKGKDDAIITSKELTVGEKVFSSPTLNQ